METVSLLFLDHFNNYDLVLLNFVNIKIKYYSLQMHVIVESGGTVVRAPALESQSCEFDSHWVSILATLGKLLT